MLVLTHEHVWDEVSCRSMLNSWAKVAEDPEQWGDVSSELRGIEVLKVALREIQRDKKQHEIGLDTEGLE